MSEKCFMSEKMFLFFCRKIGSLKLMGTNMRFVIL